MDRKTLPDWQGRKEDQVISSYKCIALAFIIAAIALAISFLCSSCSIPTEETGIKTDKQQKEIVVDHMVVDGHDYKVFTVAYQGSASMSVTHDPNCKTCLSMFD